MFKLQMFTPFLSSLSKQNCTNPFQYRQVFQRYGFEKIESKKDFESKLDRAITGLDIEVTEKRRSLQTLMDELGINSNSRRKQHDYI